LPTQLINTIFSFNDDLDATVFENAQNKANMTDIPTDVSDGTVLLATTWGPMRRKAAIGPVQSTRVKQVVEKNTGDLQGADVRRIQEKPLK
jgi:hypothetical protein